MRSLVPSVFAQLSRPGGNDAGAGSARRSHHDLPLGPKVCARIGEALPVSVESLQRLLEGGRDVHQVRKSWIYLYQAVDSQGNTLEFLLSPTRDAEAAKGFLLKALQSTACAVPPVRLAQQKATQPPVPDLKVDRSAPRVINVDKNAAYPKAVADLKATGMLPQSVELRQVKYLNNLVEQDHRFIKRLTKPGMGFFSFESAWRTLQGYEMMNMIWKGQMRGVNKGDSPGQAAFIARLFGVAA